MSSNFKSIFTSEVKVFIFLIENFKMDDFHLNLNILDPSSFYVTAFAHEEL